VPYIVDGHNLLGQIPGLRLTDPGDRGRLVSALAAFCRERRCRMTIFFDGEPPAPGGLRRAQRDSSQYSDTLVGRVRIVHSGRGRSADDAILEMIRRSRTPADITVVTSDRALYERSRHLGAKGMLGHVFREMLARDSRQGSGAHDKPERPEPGEVDYFLGLFGAEDPIDPSSSRKRR
jgi:hypothetical protein